MTIVALSLAAFIFGALLILIGTVGEAIQRRRFEQFWFQKYGQPWGYDWWTPEMKADYNAGPPYNGPFHWRTEAEKYQK